MRANGPNTRPRGTPIKVWVTSEERTAIATKADQAGLSQSAYLRAVGLNQPVRSVYDLKAVADLVRVNGDTGRIAGLLRQWIADRANINIDEIEAVIQDLRVLQDQLMQISGCALRCGRFCRHPRR